MRKLSVDELNRKSVEEFREARKIPLILILENIRSAYNIGSCFRTADAFLLKALYICGYSAFPPHKEIRKTALGAEETVEWKHFKTAKEAIEEATIAGHEVYAVEQAEESIPLHQLENPGRPLALVFGNEVTGVEQDTIDHCKGVIEIPQSGMKHSVNVAVAAGIVCWEISRHHLNNPS